MFRIMFLGHLFLDYLISVVLTFPLMEEAACQACGESANVLSWGVWFRFNLDSVPLFVTDDCYFFFHPSTFYLHCQVKFGIGEVKTFD